MPDLASLTTLRLGGPAARLFEAHTEEALVGAVRDADAAGEPVLVLAGGSNVVVADAGFDGVVVRVLTSGVGADGWVAAGEPWDPFVARCVAQGLAGVEALSGIPGSVGATPIQNVGAYGQEVAQTITAVRVWDRRDGTRAELPAAACGFTYRSSAFKRDPGRWVVLAVRFALDERPEAEARYAELRRAVGERAPLAAIREAVLGLRRGKGMVLDAADHDTWSAGSFFTNPVLDADAFAPLGAQGAPSWPEADGRVKTSAAWLIERAGFTRGYGDPAGIAISTKHVLALTNRGAGTTTALVALAREVAAGVLEAFGVTLVPEPVFAGHRWVLS